LAANKLIFSDEQKEEIRGYIDIGLTGAKIAKKMKVSQPTIWRVMEEMGVNKKKCPREKKKVKIFNWSSFKGTVI